MLWWAGLLLIVAGVGFVPFDRRVTHFFYDRIDIVWHKRLGRITHLAKAAHWLILAVIVWCVAWEWLYWIAERPDVRLAWNAASLFILALTLGSAVTHTIKLVLGRRRPRDDIEMGLYGFIPFACDLRMNSFPSGHALTITIVAVIATILLPAGAPLWFALAAALAMTRALLCAHFVSDVLVGAGIGLVSVRIVLVAVFPQMMVGWF